MLCYNKSVNRRGTDQLPLKLPLKAVGSLADGYPFPSVPLEGSVCSFSPPLYGIGLVVLLITEAGFMAVSFLTAWRVAKAREYTHANKAGGRLTVDRHWRLGTRRAINIGVSPNWLRHRALTPALAGSNPVTPARLISKTECH